MKLKNSEKVIKFGKEYNIEKFIIIKQLKKTKE